MTKKAANNNDVVVARTYRFAPRLGFTHFSRKKREKKNESMEQTNRIVKNEKKNETKQQKKKNEQKRPNKKAYK